jgi:hypothetical protein
LAISGTTITVRITRVVLFSLSLKVTSRVWRGALLIKVERLAGLGWAVASTAVLKGVMKGMLLASEQI